MKPFLSLTALLALLVIVGNLEQSDHDDEIRFKEKNRKGHNRAVTFEQMLEILENTNDK